MNSSERILEKLAERFRSEQILQTNAERFLAARDASRLQGDCIAGVRAQSEADVVALVRLADEEGFSIVPKGAGTSPTGSALASQGQVVLDLSSMNAIRAIDAKDQVVVVEPGVLTGTLHTEVEKQRLFYPPDPASSRFSTIGGNVATCAGGLRAFKYGVTRDYVLGLRAVLADGTVLVTGGRALKDVVGYDLTRLLVGSEGTLAIFTEITLRLLPLPEARTTVLADFEDDDGAFRGADEILAAGLLPRALESMDRTVLEIVCEHRKEALSERVRSRLLVEIDGALPTVGIEEGVVLAALLRAKATVARPARDEFEREALWASRRAISAAIYTKTPAKISEDIGVPRSQLAAAVRAIKAAAARHGIRALAYGHAGDANLHCNFLYDPAAPGEKDRVRAAIHDAFTEVLSRGGTISGEHGIGLKKKDEMMRAQGPRTVALLRAIKRSFDPKGILNPGKLIPDEEVTT